VKIFSQKSLHYLDFPFSIIASLNAGIGEEIIFRLFYISFFVWLFSNKLFKNKYQNIIFWIVTIVSTLTFALSHIPSVMALLKYETLNEIPIGQMIEIIILNSLASIVCAINFKKYGILSAMGIHFWTDIIYHVVWGIINN
jgi:membrane protease YdiL (CAAX protease family)